MSLKLTGLRIENYLRITLADLTFDASHGGVVALMGENEAGKSSALNALEALIAGRKAPKMAQPIHKGASSSKIIGRFREDDGSELVVTRKYTLAGGTSVVVEKNGLNVASPSDTLARFYSHVAIDPLAFANLDSKKQVETLLDLIGFDPKSLDEESANHYATRTIVGRDVDRLAAQLEGFAPLDTKLAVAELVDVGSVQDDLDRVREHNRAREELLREVETVDRAIVQLDDAIIEQENRLGAMRAELAARKDKAAAIRADVEKTQELPVDTYVDTIKSADATNEAIREQKRRAAVVAELEAARAKVAGHTARIEEIRQEKAAKFAAAKMPILGLTVEEGEVYLDGTPFSQTSAGGMLRTSTAIAMAVNPELRAIIIRDGSLLDGKNRAIIDELAKANDFLVLMEIVDRNAPTGVVFVDGEIEGAEA